MRSIPRLFCVLAGSLLIAAAAPAVNAKPATAPANPDDQTIEDKALAAHLDTVLPSIKFDGVGLGDVVDFLRDVNGANIFVNWRALEVAGIARNTPVSVNVRGAKFSKALRLVLESAGGEKTKLAYDTDSGVITISTASDLFHETTSKTYDIRFLLPEKLDAATREKRVAALLKLVIESIDPPSWGIHNGKPCTVMEMKGELIVAQTDKNHKAVENLLKQLQELMPISKP